MQFSLGYSPKDYSDPRIFDLEMAGVFGRNWICTGHESELAESGDFKTLTIGSEPVILVRDQSRFVRAFFNICPHRGYRLAKNQRGNCSELICGYHGMRFGLDGKGEKEQLCEIPVRILYGYIFIHLGRCREMETPPEEFEKCLSQSPDLPLSSSRSRSFTVAVNFNWKLYVENMIEGRHIANVHDGFESLIQSEYDFQEMGLATVSRVKLKDQGVRGWSERRYRLAIEAMTEKFEREFVFLYLYPNTLVTVYPEQVLLLHVCPLAPLKTAVHGSFVTRPGTSKASRLAQYLNRRVGSRIHMEDNLLLSEIQQNFRSESFPGKLSVDLSSDPELVHFHRCLNSQINLYSETL